MTAQPYSSTASSINCFIRRPAIIVGGARIDGKLSYLNQSASAISTAENLSKDVSQQGG